MVRFKISRLGLGTVQFGMDYGYTKTKNQGEVNSILNTAWKLGVRFLDTARDYGDSESKIGFFLRRSPAKNFLVATKITVLPGNLSATALKTRIYSSVEASREALGLKTLPLLQLHQSDDFLLKDPFFWKVISGLKKNNLCRFFGISLYEARTARDLLLALPRPLDCIQAPYNIFDQSFAALFPMFHKRKVLFISRSVFLKGLLTANASKVPEKLKAINKHKKYLEQIAGKCGLTNAEISFLFAVKEKAIACTIFGVNDPKELRFNVAALKKESLLSPYIMRELKKMSLPDADLTDPRRWGRL